LIVFPEYGLVGSIPGGDEYRSSLYPFVETIPDVGADESCMSCDSYQTGSETVNYISCLARNYGMYVVVNLLERVECDSVSGCPFGDGILIYNTNVIFDPKGCIVAKYHKYHMWGNEKHNIDRPLSPEYVFIDTPLGRLGTFICFDVAFKEPSLTLIYKYNIDTILFPTLWTMLNASTRLYQNIVEYSSGFARRHNVNFLAANVRDHSQNCYGSAISTPTGIANAYYDPQSTKGRLLLAKIPPTSNERVQNKYLHHINTEFNVHTDFHVVTPPDGRDYHVNPLDKTSDTVEVCYDSLCCKVEYENKTGSDTIILAAYSGLFLKNDSPFPLSLEVCLLQTCRGDSYDSCFDFPISESDIRFSHIQVSGHFVSSYVYPMVVSSGYEVVGFDWSYRYSGKYNEIEMEDSDWSIQSAALQTITDSEAEPVCESHNQQCSR